MINKKEIIKRVSFATSFPEKTVEDTVDSLIEIVIDALGRGETVRFTKFGVFRIRVRKGRWGVNPRNLAERIQIPDVKIVKFTPSRPLKNIVK